MSIPTAMILRYENILDSIVVICPFCKSHHRHKKSSLQSVPNSLVYSHCFFQNRKHYYIQNRS